MRVLLIGGAGRNGHLIGPKYVSKKLGVELSGVVDPRVDEMKKASSYLLKGIPTYHSVEEVPKECIQNSINEIALIPEIIPDVLKTIVAKGARKLILPKPVAASKKDYAEIKDITEANKLEALIASNWHYSNITKMLKALISKITGEDIETENLEKSFVEMLDFIPSGYKIDKVDVQYNKQHEVLTIDPPLQELPHALQIVYSTGLTNLEKIKVVMEKFLQSKSRVNTTLQETEKVKGGISLNSDLRMGDKLDKRRERVIKIYLSKGQEQAVITADYDADFKEGVCVKNPSISFEEFNKGLSKFRWEYKINEDNMNVMYDMMLKYFRGEKNNSLTIEKYNPISDCLCFIQERWKKLVSAS